MSGLDLVTTSFLGAFSCDVTVFYAISMLQKPYTMSLYGKIITKTNTSSNLSGWKFYVYTDSDLTQKVSGSPFTTGNDGIIVMDLRPVLTMYSKLTNPISILTGHLIPLDEN